MGVTISGMTGAGSIRHNNRSFSAANVDRSRTEQNIVFCNEDLKQVYHMVFDEALAAYNAKKTKTRDKIPDYYEHIRQSKQEKLFHEAIFQIGNMSDCGCGYGWHCKFAEEQGATKILGIDLSKKMIEEAQKRNSGNQIEYRISGLEEYDYPENEWDCVISNLALHYIEDIVEIFQKVYRTLKPGGIFLFNIEHPVFTAGVGQDWIYTDDGKPQYWAIDNYFITGERNTHFLGCDVVKQHHTLTQIIMGLLNNGFELKVVEEAEPPKEMMDIPGMEDELRRPMMLLVKAIAKK